MGQNTRAHTNELTGCCQETQIEQNKNGIQNKNLICSGFSVVLLIPFATVHPRDIWQSWVRIDNATRAVSVRIGNAVVTSEVMHADEVQSAAYRGIW